MPRGWPETVVVHVENEAFNRPVEPSLQVITGVVSPVWPRLADRQHRLKELAVLRAKDKPEPVLDLCHLFIREASVEWHSAEPEALDRLGDEILHAAIMPDSPSLMPPSAPSRVRLSAASGAPFPASRQSAGLLIVSTLLKWSTKCGQRRAAPCRNLGT